MPTAFPATLPLPLVANFAYQSENNIQRTPFINGRARQRILFTKVPAYIKAHWVLTDTQAQTFETFAESIGAAWFTIPLPTPNGASVTHTARFMETYDGPRRVSPDHWEYIAKLELEYRL